MTVLAVMTKAADDVVMFLEGCALETYALRGTKKNMGRPTFIRALLLTFLLSHNHS